MGPVRTALGAEMVKLAAPADGVVGRIGLGIARLIEPGTVLDRAPDFRLVRPSEAAI